MSDDNQSIQDQNIEPQNSVIPSSPVSDQPFPQSQPQPINDTVAPIPSSVYKKHGFPISFKSLSLIILFLLMGSVFVISQLSSQKGSFDLRSRASKKEASVLKNGSFEQKLLNWKEMKKDRSDKIEIIAQGATQGANTVKLTNTSGKELTLYQDVKVDPDTWYTVRTDGKRLDGDAGASIELREYNLVNGTPQFIQISLTRRTFGSTIQTRGDIVRSGKSLMVNLYKKSFSLIKKVYADYTCLTLTYIINFNQEGELLRYHCKDSDYNSDQSPDYTKGTDMGFRSNIDPADWKYGSWVKERLRSDLSIYCSKRLPCIGTVNCTKTCITDASKSCYGQAKVEFNANGSDTCNITSLGKCETNSRCTIRGPSSPPTTISVPPKPECTTDDDCTKKKPDTYCEAGSCKKRPATCGTLCYDPSQGEVDASAIDKICNDGVDQSIYTPLSCAASTDGTGKRYCWGDGCGGGGGGGGGGQKPAEKYIRIQLTMEKKGSAIFDNVRFAKGQDNAGPKIISIAPSIATVGAQLTYQVIATDENRDTLTFGLGALPCPFNNKNCKKDKIVVPKNAAVSLTGLFTFTPEAIGTANIRLWVSDGMKPVKQDFTLTIR